MKTDCPQCQSRETAQLEIPRSVAVYLKCEICGCVFVIDKGRSYAPPFIVTPGHPRNREGDGGGNSATS